MKIFRMPIIIVLVMSLVSFYRIDVHATTITPNVMCNEFGCLISSDVSYSEKPATQYYSQTDARWTTVPMKRTNGSSCGTIGSVGCALTSFAMIVQTYGDTDGNNDLLYTPATVNQKVTQSCSFDPLGWASSYNSILQYIGSQAIATANQSNLTYLRRIIAQLIADGYIVIVNGYDSGTLGYHYIVAYGYYGIVDLYDSGVVRVKSSSQININDPGYSARLELAQFMAKFESVKAIYYFKKV